MNSRVSNSICPPNVPKEAWDALGILRDGLVKHGLKPTRCKQAIDNIGKAIGESMPALASARIAAYRHIGIPSPQLKNSIRNAPDLDLFKTDKEGWRALLSNVPITTMMHNIKDVAKDNIKFIASDYEWTVGQVSYIRKINAPDSSIEDIPDGELPDLIDAARKKGLPIPPEVENIVLNVYGIAPILAPFSAKIGINSCDVAVRDSNGKIFLKSAPSILNALADVDILSQLGSDNVPSTSLPVPKTALWKYTKLLAPRSDIDNLFAHSDNEIASAILTLHPEYEVRICENSVWLANPRTGVGMPAKVLSQTWSQCELAIDNSGRIAITHKDRNIEFDSSVNARNSNSITTMYPDL